MLIISFIILSIILFVHYAKVFRIAFSPLKIFNFEIKSDEFKRLDKYSLVNSIVTKVSPNIEENVKNENIQSLLLLDAIFQFINYKLKKFISAKSYMLLFLIRLLFTLILTIGIISLLNYLLYRIDPNSFRINSIPIFFDFLNYTFYSIIPDETNLIPTSMLANFIRMSTTFLGVIITVILLTVFFSINGEKYKEGLEELINLSESQLEVIDDFITVKLSISKENAFSELEANKKSMADLITKIKEHIK